MTHHYRELGGLCFPGPKPIQVRWPAEATEQLGRAFRRPNAGLPRMRRLLLPTNTRELSDKQHLTSRASHVRTDLVLARGGQQGHRHRKGRREIHRLHFRSDPSVLRLWSRRQDIDRPLPHEAEGEILRYCSCKATHRKTSRSAGCGLGLDISEILLRVAMGASFSGMTTQR
jgi:hypothetical protein